MMGICTGPQVLCLQHFLSWTVCQEELAKIPSLWNYITWDFRCRTPPPPSPNYEVILNRRPGLSRFCWIVVFLLDFVYVCFTEIFQLISTNVTQKYLFWVVPSQTKTTELSYLRFYAKLNRLMRFSAAAVATEGKKTSKKQHIACDAVLCAGSQMTWKC